MPNEIIETRVASAKDTRIEKIFKFIMRLSHGNLEAREVMSELKRVSKMAAVGETVALIAHNINNPLVSILGYTQLLLSKTSKRDPQYKDLKKIESAALRCRKTIQSLSS